MDSLSLPALAKARLGSSLRRDLPVTQEEATQPQGLGCFPGVLVMTG